MRPHFGMGFPNVDADPKSIFFGSFLEGWIGCRIFYFLHEVWDWYCNDLTVSQIKPL